MFKQFFVFAVIVGVSYGFSDCDGSTPNTLPIYSLPPSLVSTTANGALYQSGVGVIDPPLNVLHLYGTPYQRGLAHGTLLKDDMNTLIPQVEVYMASQIEQYLTALPQWLQDLIAEAGVEAALEATFWLTEEFIPKYWLEEIQGMADGSGLDYMRLVRLHMIPELIQAQCSMVGAWGGAIANTSGSLYQLRALDWSVNGPFQQFPTYIVFHPDQGQEFAILAWAGFIGTVTGFSSAPFGLCEKVWDAYNGTRPRAGYPWHFMTRDILQFDADIDSALGRIASTQRTCSVWLGFGDYTNQFRAIGYSHDYIKVYDDKNYPSYAEHPKMEGLVYINKHVQPSHEKCLGALLQEYYGNITPEVIKTYVTALHQTGNMHIAIFDFKENFVYIANASPYVNGQYIPAYDRQFIALNMTTLFSTKL